MQVSLLLDMAADAAGDRIAATAGERSLTYEELRSLASTNAARLAAEARHVVYEGTNSLVVPVALFAAAAAGVPYAPLSYRMAAAQLAELRERLAPMAVADASWLEAEPPAEAPAGLPDPDDVAIVLHTSGTTATPKAALLRHRHLFSYVIGTVEFAAADPEEAQLVAVPPYHVAGVASILTSVYAGRRVVLLDEFSPERWLSTVEGEGVTHAMVVPTMLARIVDHLVEAGARPPATLRHLAYGGGRTPLPVIERALELFPDVGFVNAYGLTETSSTIAVLGPEDHRSPAKLGSVGRPVPGIEVDVRDGEIWVRGEQVSGEYAGIGTSADDEGWFPTRDRGRLDDDGYLWIEGRADDVIIRGGENIAPAEIEEVLLRHPAVAEAAAVGVPDTEWGERVAAVVVAKSGSVVDIGELRDWGRARLRSSRAPEVIEVWEALPYTPTGKLLRRDIRAQLGDHVR